MRFGEENFVNQVDGVIEPIIANNVLMIIAILGLLIDIIFIIGRRYGKQM